MSICCCFGNECDRGGFFRQAPEKLIMDSDNRLIRANLLFSAQNWCCGAGHGVIDEIPEEFYTRYGLLKGEMEEWLYDKPYAINKRYRSSVLSDFSCLLLELSFFCFLPCFCSWDKRYIEAWDAELRQWQKDLNEKVLEPKGYFAKTQSRCDETYRYVDDGRTETDRHIERWVSIAFTPEAVAELKEEEHVIGATESWACIGGFDEATLCMHP
eukprot:gene43405-53063_t